MNRSTLFFQNLTAIDHAIILPGKESIQGGSYNLSVWVTGNIEEQEQVVVDFSTLKKSIKSLIDKKQGGFDHKLWVSPDYVSKKSPIKDSVYIETPFFSSLVPDFSIKELPFEQGDSIEDIAKDEIRIYLEEYLNRLYPNSDIETKVFLSEKMNCSYSNNEKDMFSFRYVHGLKNSSSEACQNINHGHISYMGLENNLGNTVSIEEELPYFENYRNSIFVWKDNVISNDKNWVTVGYTAPTGTFFSRYNKEVHNVFILPCETTVENLAHWLKTEHEYELEKTGAELFMVSEGLVKGSVVYL